MGTMRKICNADEPEDPGPQRRKIKKLHAKTQKKCRSMGE
jgi:hypothetical protein